MYVDGKNSESQSDLLDHFSEALISGQNITHKLTTKGTTVTRRGMAVFMFILPFHAVTCVCTNSDCELAFLIHIPRGRRGQQCPTPVLRTDNRSAIVSC